MTRPLEGRRVQRLDAIPLDQTYYTDEGYLIDNPVVTSTGIFEYALPGGGIRRELRRPEDVFAPESLASYEGKPIIITHNAGEVDKDNVDDVNIGTILSKGYRDGDNVRAKIVIHDTDAMRNCGLRELSLGYNLVLDETPGVWEGQPYDAIQTQIEINHLALVDKARAGRTARLNIDSRDADTLLKGAKTKMTKNTKKRRDGDMSPEDFAKALEAFKARRAARMAAHQEPDGDEGQNPKMPPDNDGDEGKAVPGADGAGEAPAATTSTEPGKDEGTGASAQQQAQSVKDRRDSRDAAGDPTNMDEAMNCIAQQDEDIDTLLALIDSLCASGAEDGDDTDPAAGTAAAAKEPTAGEPKKDGDEGKAANMNADSVDAIVRTRVNLARIGDRLNMDGLDSMSILGAKKAIIKKVKPSLRLDGKSEAYITAAFDMAMSEINNRKDTNFQRRQMFNGDSATTVEGSASESRQKMIARHTNQNGGNK